MYICAAKPKTHYRPHNTRSQPMDAVTAREKYIWIFERKFTYDIR